MSAAMLNALILLGLALLAACALFRRRGGRQEHERAPESEEALRAELAKRYARKTRWRVAVLVCCLLAAAVYAAGCGRIAALALLACAGFCQYGAARQKTGRYLSLLMRRKAPHVPDMQRK